jgi:hypothetical protein
MNGSSILQKEQAMKTLLTSIAVVLAVAGLSAHIMVSPAESQASATQKYSSAAAAQARPTTMKPMTDEEYAKAMKEVGPTFMSLQRATPR